MNYVLEIIAKC